MSGACKAFWGKAQPDSVSAVKAHPIIAHALDVAAVAVLLPRDGFDLDLRALGWLVSLHDIGKFSRPFQAKEPLHWPEVWLGMLDPDDMPPPGPRHDALALVLLEDVCEDLMTSVLPQRLDGVGWVAGDRVRLFRAVAGHHGRPVAKPTTDAKVLGLACETAARAFVQAMTDVFRPRPIPCPADSRAASRLEWGLTAVTTLADWVGSRQAWFPYVSQTVLADPTAYFWTHALPRAAAALEAAGLVRARPARFRGLRTLFPGIVTPSPVQHWAEHVSLPDSPVLAVIEDLTGSGKTEAAVILAHRLLASGLAHGLFLALPTMATANAMFDRMANAYRHLFEDTATPSLVLAHGRAALDPRFAPGFTGDPGASGARSEENDPADWPAESHCADWLAEDRRRALLAEVGVGTIDQALLAVLPVRHATLRQQGLRGKVLIVDEAHAFDPYMREELAALLLFHASMGGSAILLSATLPHALRQRLVDAYRKGLGTVRAELRSTAYPLATLIGADDRPLEQPCDPRDGLPRTVTVTRAPSMDAVLVRVVAAVRSGAAVAWVRNTVDDALAAVALLRAQGIEPLVFHARFALCDRLRIETEVLQRFGKNGDPTHRPGVLVATQVVEQSLDLDFDLLCTDLAPVDSLIQRAGRLWRHDRARVLAGPELLVLSPEPVPAPDAGWIAGFLPGTAAVYRDPALLWRSARAIFARGILVTPDDMRPMIEAAAGSEVPPGLAARAHRAMGADAAAAGIGRQNVLDFRRGYTPGSGAWEPDTRTPTRLEDRPQVMVRLARRLGDQIVPYAPVGGTASKDDVRRAWSSSEFSVAKYRLASCPLVAEWHAAAQAARQGWGCWERDSEHVLLAVLEVTSEAGTYMFTGQAQSGALVQVCYTLHEGLCWIDSLSAA